jgi:hypothetical protein
VNYRELLITTKHEAYAKDRKQLVKAIIEFRLLLKILSLNE